MHRSLLSRVCKSMREKECQELDSFVKGGGFNVLER